MPKKNYGQVRETTIGNLKFAVWCDGRSYDPELEVYRPIYSYSIMTDSWRYDANDIQGAPNKPPNTGLASAALMAIFLSCVEADDDDDNAELFPPHVREAGQYVSNQLAALCAELTGE